MRAEGAGAIGPRRIDHDTNLDIGILPLELRDHLRLRRSPWIACVVRVEERVVGDLHRLRNCRRCYRDDQSECGDQVGDALPPGTAACCAALGKRLALVHCSHCFLRCRYSRLGTARNRMAQVRCGRRALRSQDGNTLTPATPATGLHKPLAFPLIMCNDIPDPTAMSSTQGEKAG